MMKKNQKPLHYDILRVAMDASPVEIRDAYQDILEVYQDQSMAALAFFSDSERKAILSRLDEAYHVLINPETRSLYDQTLIEMGIMKEGTQYRNKNRPALPPYHARRKRPPHQWVPRQPGVDKAAVSENTLVQEVMKQDQVTGQDLKKIRTTLGVSLEWIVMQTRITHGTLEAIEEDQFDRLPPLVYLKGFLKLYAQCLQLDANILIKGYMNHYKMT